MNTELTDRKILTLARGRVYRAKRPERAMIPEPAYDDRQIISVDLDKNLVVYGCPSNTGSNYPKTSVSEFLQWAKREVTGELPEHGWMPFPLIPRKKRQPLNKPPENVRLTDEQLTAARVKYLTLHLHPVAQAKAIAEHYLAMAKGAQMLQDSLELREKFRSRRGCRCPGAEKDIETIVNHIKDQHLKAFGLSLRWSRTLNDIPQ